MRFEKLEMPEGRDPGDAMDVLGTALDILRDRANVMKRQAQQVSDDRGTCYESIELESCAAEAEKCTNLVGRLVPIVLNERRRRERETGG